MNIIIGKELHEYLQTIKQETLLFGSRAGDGYNDNSDYDYLHIVKCHKALNVSPVYTGHWLQYKEVDENGKTIADHVYSTVPQFIHGVIDAESMIPWEILNYAKSDRNKFSFENNDRVSSIRVLENIQNEYNGVWYNALKENFKSARGFLGLARRDVKDASKYYNSDKERARKKILFAEQSLDYAEICMRKFYETNYPNKLIWEQGNSIDWRNWNTDYQVFKRNLDQLNKYIDDMRAIAQDLHNRKLIPYSVSEDAFNRINTTHLKNITLLEDNKYSDIMLNHYYKAAIENDYK